MAVDRTAGGKILDQLVKMLEFQPQIAPVEIFIEALFQIVHANQQVVMTTGHCVHDSHVRFQTGTPAMVIDHHRVSLLRRCFRGNRDADVALVARILVLGDITVNQFKPA